MEQCPEPYRTINLQIHKPIKVVEHGDFITIITKRGPLLEFSLSDTNYKREILLSPVRISSLLYLKSSEVIAGYHNGDLKKLNQNFENPALIGQHKGAVVNLQYDEESTILYSSSLDCSVQEWELLTKNTKELYRHSAGVVVLVFDSKSKRLLSGSSDQVLIIYSVISGNIEHQINLLIKPWGPDILEYQSILGSFEGKVMIFHEENPFKNPENTFRYQPPKSASKNTHPILSTLSFNETISKVCKKTTNFVIHDFQKDIIRAGVFIRGQKFLISFGGDTIVNIWKKSKFCFIPSCRFCNHKKLKISHPV